MSQMYPAFSQSKKSKSNRELLEDLKANSLNWYEVEHQGYTLPSTLEPHSWCGQWIWKGCLNVPGHDGKYGFGGSCFPKDIQALIKYGDEIGVDMGVLKAAWETNLKVRPEKDWEELKGRAVVDE